MSCIPSDFGLFATRQTSESLSYNKNTFYYVKCCGSGSYGRAVGMNT